MIFCHLHIKSDRLEQLVEFFDYRLAQTHGDMDIVGRNIFIKLQDDGFNQCNQYFSHKHYVERFKTEPENKWFFRGSNRFDDSTILKRSCSDLTIGFEIDHSCNDDDVYSFQLIGDRLSKETLLFSLDSDFESNDLDQLISATVEHFDQKQNVSMEDVNEYLKNEHERISSENLNEWAKAAALKQVFGDLTVGFGTMGDDVFSFQAVGERFPEKNLPFKLSDDFSSDDLDQLIQSTVEHFDQKQNVNIEEVHEYLKNEHERIYYERTENQYVEDNAPEPAPHLDRQIETATKAGYVQGVCESVLAFNTDENRNIMSESAMTMLSKKLLSEMKVTQNMALIYANPKTYQALEQSIFAPKQEQAINRPRKRG